ncbi:MULTISPECIES: tripartite tricarboxylate transporter substrate binding protein [unclassified Variovorax]|jgi:tripartite-type tricarboxylate transporter receptor subunit TctC|uniref:Bug family tripartite tricarboxylate transporter substrate binding protein n=1 Tax=unclassified Variovorax TaxID=663243 RepID=UPI0008BD16D8|nr:MULTISPECIES: tripartite tricarboxylate transporter substrate binding protein [unclassified Variovorax]SEK11286.1 Tripartite-type tricarboxylate transporter, receptor component TctC [Variovorax sp. OK202]SFD73632.1 Tripartite-type tricarboxylate transporter, receptor component TctC [Variovorax sp. OK212]
MFASSSAWARRIAVAGLAAAAMGAWAEYPERPLKFIVPYAAGSGVDVSMRPVADAMGRELGQAIAVDNRPSAGGIVGTQAVVTAAPDGYTVGYGNLVTLSINSAFFSKLPYAPAKDLVPIGLISSNAYVVIVRKDLPVRNLQELIAYGRAHPGQLSVGSPGIGSAGHLTGELLKAETGLAMVQVPYKTGTQAVGDMVNGQLDVTIENIAAVLPFVQQGRVKAIAVTSAKRASVLPDVATVAESGVPGFDVVAWGAMVAPAGTPRKVVDRLNTALRAALADPAVLRAYAALSVEALPSSPEELSALMKRETPRWAEAVRRAGVKGD